MQSPKTACIETVVCAITAKQKNEGWQESVCPGSLSPVMIDKAKVKNIAQMHFYISRAVCSSGAVPHADVTQGRITGLCSSTLPWALLDCSVAVGCDCFLLFTSMAIRAGLC